MSLLMLHAKKTSCISSSGGRDDDTQSMPDVRSRESLLKPHTAVLKQMICFDFSQQSDSQSLECLLWNFPNVSLQYLVLKILKILLQI